MYLVVFNCMSKESMSALVLSYYALYFAPLSHSIKNFSIKSYIFPFHLLCVLTGLLCCKLLINYVIGLSAHGSFGFGFTALK